MSEFTYIIRSINKTSANDFTNNCYIQLTGLPSNFHEFECEVINFYASTENITFTSSIIELKASNLSFKDGFDTFRNSLKTLAITIPSNNNPSLGFKFRVANFNNQTVNFQLVDEDNYSLKDDGNIYSDNYNNNWILILKMKGVQ